MEPDSIITEDFIFTDDLGYSSPNGRYTYRFRYLGDGVFSLISRGVLDDKTLKHQLASGDKARERLKALFSDKKYHLIWDVTELKRGTLLARYMAIAKVKSEKQFGSLTFIGANSFIKNFGTIAVKLLPNIKLFFFDNYDDAILNLEKNLQKLMHLHKSENNKFSPEIKSYNHFINLWQENPDFIQFFGQQYKMTSCSKWQYQAPDSNCRVKTGIIEGNIVYFECEGFLKAPFIDICYGILENIMAEMSFNATDNKFYTILNLRKVKGISLGARKRISFFEQMYKDRSYMVIIVGNPTLLLVLRILRTISLDNFYHWGSTDTAENAFTHILKHRKVLAGMPEQSEEKTKSETELIIPRSPEDMSKLIIQQHAELLRLKKDQKEEIQKVIEMVGRMTWDESFNIPQPNKDKPGPFDAVYNSLSILFQDFKEIIQEKQFHTQKLIESEDKYRNLIDLASDVILVYQDDRVKFLNSRVEQALGYKPEEVVGKNMNRFVAPEEIDRLRDYYFRRAMGEEIPPIYESVFLHRNGHRVPVSMSVGVILYESRPASLVIARDITQKKKTEEELERYRNHLEDIIKQRTNQLQKEINERKVAEESDRLKTAFLSNMSHEIRTPMNAIISFSNFLKEPDIPEIQRNEYLDYILSSGHSLLNLINDIIDIAKIEAKQLSTQECNTNINAILEELYKLFEETRKSLNKYHISLRLSIPDREKKIILFTDPYRLKQILSNLINNALKFTDTGHITFGFKIEDNAILFFVQDTGIGIPEDKQEFIFKRFGKIENLGKNISGTGLGLAISKHLASLLHGTLWVESNEGKGSNFYLKLPYSNAQDDVPEQIVHHPVNGHYNWRGKRILIAEDEDLNFKVLQIALRKTNVDVVRAHNGKEALEIVNTSSEIDLILMDIQMPVMDGYEAMLHIKKVKPQLPIIAQTAFALLEEQSHCLEMGFSDYISKPIKPEELFLKIEMQLINPANP